MDSTLLSKAVLQSFVELINPSARQKFEYYFSFFTLSENDMLEFYQCAMPVKFKQYVQKAKDKDSQLALDSSENSANVKSTLLKTFIPSQYYQFDIDNPDPQSNGHFQYLIAEKFYGSRFHEEIEDSKSNKKIPSSFSVQYGYDELNKKLIIEGEEDRTPPIMMEDVIESSSSALSYGIAGPSTLTPDTGYFQHSFYVDSYSGEQESSSENEFDYEGQYSDIIRMLNDYDLARNTKMDDFKLSDIYSSHEDIVPHKSEVIDALVRSVDSSAGFSSVVNLEIEQQNTTVRNQQPTVLYSANSSIRKMKQSFIRDMNFKYSSSNYRHFRIYKNYIKQRYYPWIKSVRERYVQRHGNIFDNYYFLFRYSFKNNEIVFSFKIIIKFKQNFFNNKENNKILKQFRNMIMRIVRSINYLCKFKVFEKID